MTRFVLRRLLESIPLLAIISLLVFALLQASPGSPLAQLERDPTISQDDIERIADELGLNDPFLVQYGRWAMGALQGDFGTSLQTRRPVMTEILDRLPNTVILVGAGFLFTLLVAIPIGVMSAVRQYSWFDHIVTTITFMGQSMPVFWLGLMLIYIFAVWMQRQVIFGVPIMETPLSFLVLPPGRPPLRLAARRGRRGRRERHLHQRRARGDPAHAH